MRNHHFTFSLHKRNMVLLLQRFKIFLLPLLLFLLSTCNAEEQDHHDTSSILETLNGLNEKIKVMESHWNNVTSELRSKFETALDEEETKLTSVLSYIEHELQSKLKQLESNVTSKISSLELTTNATQEDLAELKSNWTKMHSQKYKCKEGWFLFQGSCYYFSTDVASWSRGRKRCLEMDSDYAKITTDAEFNYVASQISDDTFIGLRDSDSHGTWRWVSDGTIQAINRAWWHDNQPNNWNNEQHCIHYHLSEGKKLWNDKECYSPQRYACEMKADKTL